MKKYLIIIALITLNYAISAQTTYVPDDNFEQALIDLGYDDVPDDYVLTSNISGVTYLNLYNKGISNLTGIEDFVKLQILYCHYNQLTSLDVCTNTALQTLLCYNNQLMSLDVSANTSLQLLSCFSNQLSSLDVGTNTALQFLYCDNNQLTSLDVSTNTSLQSLSCYSNQLTNLDVSTNTSLQSLSCYNNQLTSLDVSNNPILKSLNCYNNQITSLDVSANTSLQSLLCYLNQLISLDVSTNTSLQYLYCHYNRLTSLDVSTNTALQTLYCNNNQLTSLDVSTNTALQTLYCNNNQLTSLDVSTNTAMQTLLCYNNQLTSLDVSTNTDLQTLLCDNNQLTSLYVSTNTSLQYLYCHFNQLTSLDVSTNTALQTLYCYNNQLTSLDVSANTSLQTLYCSNNQLTSLDVSTNTALQHLYCHFNQLTSLNISTNTALQNLVCTNNQLTSLDVSTNTALQTLSCASNQLTSLNVNNGYNTLIRYFDARNNPDLTKIIVDNPSDVNAGLFPYNNWFKDATATYDNNLTYIPDDNFEQALIDLGYDDVLDDYVLSSNISEVTSLDISKKNIESLEGIEDFSKIIRLVCYSNQLTKLDLSQNIELKYLSCTYNPLTELNVSNNKLLESLYCSSNQLTNLDISQNELLINLECASSNLTSLDISRNTIITSLNCNSNQLTSLDVSKNTQLKALLCGWNKLSNIDLSNNTSLQNIFISSNQLTSLDVSNNTLLQSLSCASNQLTGLDVSNNTSLKYLFCNNNQLTSFDVNNNTSLLKLSCERNQLMSFDVSNNTALQYFRCYLNQLTSLNIKNGQNDLLLDFDGRYNPNLKYIVVDNAPAAYAKPDWQKDELAIYVEYLDFSPPVLTGVPDDVEVECHLIPAMAEVSAEDDVDGIVEVLFEEVRTDGTCVNHYTLTRTWSAADAAGNQVSESQVVSVVDHTAPTIVNPPADILVNTDAGSTEAIVNYEYKNIFNENCINKVALEFSMASGSAFPLGTTVVTITASDECGNVASVHFNIVVEDKEKPEVMTQNITIELNEEGKASITPQQIDNGSNDEFDISLALDKTEFTCADVGDNTVTLTVTDANGNSASADAIVSVQDLLPPVVVAQGTTVQLDASGNASIAVEDIDRGSTDNCGIASRVLSQSSFDCSNVGTNIVTLTVSDLNGNVGSSDVNVVVVDNISPVALCKDISVYLEINGEVSITAEQVDNGSNDACGMASMSVYPEIFTTSNVGDNAVELTVVDNNGNSSVCTANVTVLKRPVDISYSGDKTEQYSDQTMLSAIITDQLTGVPLSDKYLQFVLGNAITGATSDASGLAARSLIITQAPEWYTVEVIFNGDAIFQANAISEDFEIKREDARSTYTGALYASTSGSTSSIANVTLSATVRDISLADPYDVYPGDIRNASVTFIDLDKNEVINSVPLPVGLINSSNMQVGTVTYNWNVDIGNDDSREITVGIRVDNYYSRFVSEENTVITVAKPISGFVTGGGYLLLDKSEGLKAGDKASKNNFGFSIKYNKTGTNLQGRINSIIRRTEEDGILHVYQIKGNAMTSLAINDNTAIFNGKASIEDITDLDNIISVEGNAVLQVEMVDNGEPGTTDLLSITVWDKKGGMWYASNWDGQKTQLQTISGGNIAIHDKAVIKIGSIDGVFNDFDVEVQVIVYPTVVNDRLYFKTQGIVNGSVYISIYNIAGELVLKDKRVAIQNDLGSLTLNARDVAPGYYVVTVSSNGFYQIHTTRILKK